MAKKSSNDISQTGVFAALAASIKSKPGTLIISVTPTVRKPIINPINVEAPTRIKIIPMNFAKIFRKNITMSPMASKNDFELDFILLLCLDTSMFFTVSETVWVTFSKPSLIFFSMLLMFTGSPVMVSLSAVVTASGTKIQKSM